MKNTLAKLTSSFVIVGICAGLLTALGIWLYSTYGVSPSFPYYHSLLKYVGDAGFGVWGYFDGVHYLRLVESGYVDTGTQAFFPLYPLLTSLISQLTGLNAYISGLILSWTSLTLSLLVLWDLYPKQKNLQTICLLLFPTSFFLLGIYTESLFLLLSLGFFLSLKKERYVLASVLAGLASATRLVGIFLALALAISLYRRYRLTRPIYSLCLLAISITGLLLYCLYLYTNFGDPLMFLHVQSLFGASRSDGELILLPQVLYRYLKMITTVDPTSFAYQRIWLELITFLGAIWFWYRNLKNQSKEINLYVIASLLLPTLTGTLSSLPRYILVLVPFLIPQNHNRISFFILSTFNFLLLIYLFSHFAHGTFVA